MSPKHLVTVMQQAVGAIISVFQTGMADCIPEHDACLEYVNAEYVPTRIAALVDEGIRLTRILQQMVAELPCPVIAEGRVHTPEQAKKMLELGAWAVVVGGAITRPLEIATRFMTAVGQR